jgi:diaminohydroxyphosphoribosylaminopyrimidine deaminase / 5-amino-6-(5-phosphoribosylamino)uracil reductase
MSGDAPRVYAGEDLTMRHELLQAQTAAAVHSVEGAPSIDLAAAWRLLLAVAGRAPADFCSRADPRASDFCSRADPRAPDFCSRADPRASTALGSEEAGLGFACNQGRWLDPLGAAPRGTAQLWFDQASQRVVAGAELEPDAAQLLDLFLPLLLASPAGWTIGHLGQSLDGRVATPSGASQFITGHDDLVHTHRLRALSQAVLVGVRTVELDDPQLTTRLVPGPHPVRVVLDPNAKLERGRRLLEDRTAPTLVVTQPECYPARRRSGHVEARGSAREHSVEWLGCPAREGRFDLHVLLGLLKERGLTRIFVEGGGVTVSRFLAAGLLDRLHVSVAPLILGSGAPAFALPPIDRLDQALALRVRHFGLGRDMLFDCQIASGPPGV